MRSKVPAKLSWIRDMPIQIVEPVLSTRDNAGSHDGDVTILVVDDSPIYRKAVEQSLSKAHHHLLFVKNGYEALQAFTVERPDIVITDWSMPDMSGLQLCRHVREN